MAKKLKDKQIFHKIWASHEFSKVCRYIEQNTISSSFTANLHWTHFQSSSDLFQIIEIISFQIKKWSFLVHNPSLNMHGLHFFSLGARCSRFCVLDPVPCLSSPLFHWCLLFYGKAFAKPLHAPFPSLCTSQLLLSPNTPTGFGPGFLARLSWPAWRMGILRDALWKIPRGKINATCTGESLCQLAAASTLDTL